MARRGSALALRKAEFCRNLQTLHDTHVTASDIALGRAWYPEAHRIVREWSKSYGYSVRTVACVIAALSPQCEWTRNLIIADDVLADRAISVGGALHANIAKARRILEDGATDTLMYFPGGPKVASFARNLWGETEYATVDGHAAQAAVNDCTFVKGLPWAPYTVLAECYAEVANANGYETATFQAIIWHTWKRLYPRAVKNQTRKQRKGR